MKHLSLIFITILLLSSAHAAKFYRHVPFNISVKPGDTIVVNYDFSKKNGIHCTSSNHSKFQVDFVYKGHQKSANLPVILQNARVPEEKYEELADVEGQYSLALNTTTISSGEHEVGCNYIER